MAKQLVDLDNAIKLVNEAHQNDPQKSGKSFLTKGTLYNAFSSKRLTRHGPYHHAQVDVAELLREFGPNKYKRKGA